MGGHAEITGPVDDSSKVLHLLRKMWLGLGCPVLVFRYFHWRLTRLLALLWALCLRVARSLVFQIVLVVVIVWQGPIVYKQVTGHTTSWVVIAVLLALAGFVMLAVRSRGRTVFQDFPDCTTPDAKGAVPGLGAYLANEVDRLGALYRAVKHQQQAEKGAGRIDDPIQPTAELDDTAEFLQNAVSPDAKLSFGPVSIPVGSILGLVARLMKGPQITGSLHCEGDRLILLANYAGVHSQSWRVRGKPGSAATDDKGRWDLHPLVEEMATRMLADLTLASTSKFRAVEAFTRAARASLDDGGPARPQLLRQLDVRNCLIEAIAEDETFDLAWYNLGVALLALDDTEMARSVFMQARESNPRRWEATYALAALPGQAETRALLCDQLLSTRPGPAAEARAYDLLGLLCQEQAGPASAGAELTALAVANRRLASRRAWRALRQAEWTAHGARSAVQLEAARRLAATCLTNLAVCYKLDTGIAPVTQKLRRAEGIAAGLDRQGSLMRQRSWQNGQRLPSFRPLLLGGTAADWKRRRDAHRDLKQAKRNVGRARRPTRQVELLLTEASALGPLDPRAHRELGTLNMDLRRWRSAVRRFSQALQVMIDDPDDWVSLACAAAKANRKPLACQAAQALLTLAPLVQPNQLKRVAAAVAEFDPALEQQLQKLAALDGQIGKAIAGAKRGGDDARAQLRELTNTAGAMPGAAWANYRGASTLCRLEPADSPALDQVVHDMLRATRRLDQECAPAVREKNIHYAVAQTLASKGQVKYALDHAQKATQTEPFTPWPWQLLGDLRRERKEYGEAEDCYLTGLRWATRTKELLELTVSLAACQLDRLTEQPDARPADDGLLDTRDRLEQLLPLLQSAALWDRTKVHYWLGQIAVTLNDGQQAIGHFAAAAPPPGAASPKDRVVGVLAAWLEATAMMQAGLLDEARAAFDTVADAIVGFEPDARGNPGTVRVGLGKPPTLAEIFVDALLSNAALTLQAASPAEAKLLIQRAVAEIPALPGAARAHATGRSEALLGRAAAMEGRDDIAVDHLLRSVNLVSDALTYVSLAEACVRAARGTRALARRERYRRLIDDCGHSIKAIGADGNHPQHIEELAAQLEAIVAQLPARKAAKGRH